MNNRLQNELSDEQLDAISGGSYSKDCDDGRGKDNDRDDKKRGEHHRKHHRNADKCAPTYRAHRCG